MKVRCEIFVTEILPNLRKEIVILLYKKYGLSQSKIAEKLGITQAAVSQYLNNNRGKKEINFDKNEKKIIEEIAHIIATQDNSKNVGNLFCEICIRRFGECNH